ncbi:MAG: GNAT family N-acetyltransferase [Negativicutes bacterium]|nr:GNAT family N-acetyltransferase [Negativicutes bacterium]
MCTNKLSDIKIEISSVCREEINSLIDIHCKSLPDDVLPNIGIKTISRYYEKAFTMQEKGDSIIAGAYQNNHLVGFCCLLFSDISFLSIIKFDTILNCSILMFKNPKILFDAIYQFINLSYIQTSSSEIAFFAVNEEYRGHGLGLSLIKYCIKKSKELDLTYIQTKTSNTRLAFFYITLFKATVINKIRFFDKSYYIIKFKI